MQKTKRGPREREPAFSLIYILRLEFFYEQRRAPHFMNESRYRGSFFVGGKGSMM